MAAEEEGPETQLSSKVSCWWERTLFLSPLGSRRQDSFQNDAFTRQEIPCCDFHCSTSGI